MGGEKEADILTNQSGRGKGETDTNHVPVPQWALRMLSQGGPPGFQSQGPNMAASDVQITTINATPRQNGARRAMLLPTPKPLATRTLRPRNFRLFSLQQPIRSMSNLQDPWEPTRDMVKTTDIQLSTPLIRIHVAPA